MSQKPLIIQMKTALLKYLILFYWSENRRGKKILGCLEMQPFNTVCYHRSPEQAEQLLQSNKEAGLTTMRGNQTIAEVK